MPDSRLGLSIMRERMEQIKGSLRIGRAESGGTLVAADAPLAGALLASFPADGRS